jgi:uncharacterized DUF497 family protein
MLSFEWDETKAKLNERKHGVTFHEACSVFYDASALQFFDHLHAASEDRFTLLGLSHRLRLLVVVHCERDRGSKIRIISARKATSHEARHYLKEWQ